MNRSDFVQTMNDASRQKRAAELLVREAAQTFEAAERERAKRGQRFSIVRTVSAAAADGLRDGFEFEMSQELARRAGTQHDRHRPFVPWSALMGARAMVVGTGSAGGYLVSEPTSPAVNALFPHSTVVRLGAQVWSGLVGDINVPRVSGNATGYWLGEVGTATESAPTMGQIQCSPRRPGAYAAMSRNLLRTPQSEAMIGAHLLDLVGGLVDKSVYNGTGTDQPVGILNAAGVTLTTGTAYDNAAAQAQVKVAAAANVQDINIRAVGAPAVRELLAKRASNGTGSPYLWSGGMLANTVPAVVSGNAPASTVIVGDFTTIVLPFWGDGLQLEVNPYAQFQAGIVGFRVLPLFDVAVTQPAAFAVSTGLT